MSFDIALSGIQAINQQLGTISNNIANAGTYGFKASRANFASQYAGDQATGVQIGSVTQSIGKNGGVVNTGIGLDAAINGRGFFVTKDIQGQNNYTRVGIFHASTEGYLVDASDRRVQGFSITPPSTTLGPMGDLQVPTGQIPAVASENLKYVSNLSADWKTIDPAVNPFAPPTTTPTVTSPAPESYNMSRVSVVYDSQGNQHTMTQYFIKTATNNVHVTYAMDGNGMDPALDIDLPFDAKGAIDAAALPDPKHALTYDPANGAAVINLTIDYTGTTQFAGEATTSTNKADGYASGTFIGVELAKDGSLVAKYSNDQRQSVGKLTVATFPDEGSLTPVSDTSWLASNDSGTPLFGTPGNGMAGALSVASLEQSNVDVTTELVGLMTSQRNYQANSKVIQTESAMLQSLMQAL
ncbi:flagellar hook-basal body complex protein [Pseudoduganella aquatica]|uniref:Flagellar hook protein FlgE n=1 Tax=Pseudoduganella aquatica TaxID=2660641 RepID=A0A7X4H8U7_9BURK|nr:flagellar hook-basal body complex protein [Pseudoduganella aquatica]MYN06394.1 flagellar hook-basal body complex protein [Pseudoduganella aquatica]